MTELDTLKRAKMYIDKLANGIDPLTDKNVSDNDCINQVRISRCLFYVSDVLRKLIDNEGLIEKPKKVKKIGFTITQEEIKKYTFDEQPTSVTMIAKKINELVDSASMGNLKTSSITTFLLQSGFLVEHESLNGRKSKVPTNQGRSIGISREERIGQNGPYFVNIYNAEAQQFILDNIYAIIEINNNQKDSGDRKEQTWTKSYDEVLIDLYNKNVPISEIAITLKKTEPDILERMKKLGIK